MNDLVNTRLEAAKAAIDRLHGTSAADLTDILEAVEELQSHLDDITNALHDDIRRAESAADNE